MRFLILILCLLAMPAQAEMKTINVGCCTIHYDPALTSPVPAAVTEKINKLNDRMEIISDRAYPFDIRLMAGEKLYYGLFCDSGPSGDPACHLVSPKCQWWEDKIDTSTNPYCQPLQGFPGTEFTIQGDNCLYASGHTNNMFNEHRKYCRNSSGSITEVQQNVLKVGLVSTALQDITLYNDQMLSRPVTIVKKGEPVEVIAAQAEPQKLDTKSAAYRDSQIYLLSDKNGITGWTSLEYGNQQATQIKGLFYNGD